METHYPGYLALLEELRGSLDQLTGLEIGRAHV